MNELAREKRNNTKFDRHLTVTWKITTTEANTIENSTIRDTFPDLARVRDYSTSGLVRGEYSLKAYVGLDLIPRLFARFVQYPPCIVSN